jgi:ribosomal-protein-alanine N-acetyltransferase
MAAEGEIFRPTLALLPAMLDLERRAYSHPWSEASLREALVSPDRFLCLAGRSAAGELVGYGIFQIVADELHVHNVAVEPGARRQGLARALLLEALTRARQAQVRVAHLEVREGNKAALALYSGLGFQMAGRRADYYDDPREDALLLTLALS